MFGVERNLHLSANNKWVLRKWLNLWYWNQLFWIDIDFCQIDVKLLLNWHRSWYPTFDKFALALVGHVRICKGKLRQTIPNSLFRLDNPCRKIFIAQELKKLKPPRFLIEFYDRKFMQNKLVCHHYFDVY